MHTINPEVINLTLFAAVGIWTLVRFLGSRGERMSTRVLFAFAPHAAFGFAMVMASCSAKTEASAPEACDTGKEYIAYADLLHRQEKASDMCARMEDPINVPVCSFALPPSALNNIRMCEELRARNRELARWLDSLMPAAQGICRGQPGCNHYLNRVETGEHSPFRPCSH